MDQTRSVPDRAVQYQSKDRIGPAQAKLRNVGPDQDRENFRNPGPTRTMTIKNLKFQTGPDQDLKEFRNLGPVSPRIWRSRIPDSYHSTLKSIIIVIRILRISKISEFSERKSVLENQREQHQNLERSFWKRTVIPARLLHNHVNTRNATTSITVIQSERLCQSKLVANFFPLN